MWADNDRGRPGEERPPMSIDADTRILRLTGCPCGCIPGEPCVTEQPAPVVRTCPCSTLGIEQLVKPEALRWHLAGHRRAA